MNLYRALVKWLAEEEVAAVTKLIPQLQAQAYEIGFARGQQSVLQIEDKPVMVVEARTVH